MSVKDDVIRRLDQDIEAFIKSSEDKPASLRMKRLEHYTALRNDLDMMPLNAPQIDALYCCGSLLETADKIYNKHIAPDEKQPDFTELTYQLISHVYREERMEGLWERLRCDNESFREELLQKSPKEIYDKAYEITIKNDLLMLFEESDMSARKIDTLMSFSHPLDAMYQEWLDIDASHMDMLRDSVDDLIHEQDGFLRRQDYITHGETPSEDILIWNAMYDGDNMRFPDEENEADGDMEL